MTTTKTTDERTAEDRARAMRRMESLILGLLLTDMIGQMIASGEVQVIEINDFPQERNRSEDLQPGDAFFVNQTRAGDKPN